MYKNPNSKNTGRDIIFHTTRTTHTVQSHIYRVNQQKSGTLFLSIFSPISDQFSKHFDWQTLQTICNNAIITYPVTL